MEKIYKIIILLVLFLNTILVCVNIAMVCLKSRENPELLPVAGLYLTPRIKLGHIEDAQKLSKVQHPDFLSVESYSGYLTVNESTNSHMFFWYFPAAKASSTAPLILWLNGGPGWSSMYGLFIQIGPFQHISQNELVLRKHSWHRQYNLVFIDNPVGVGFSRTDNGYATNEEDVGRDLNTAMRQFFCLFPKLASNEFYIAGESYAGKYVPALAYAIHVTNQKSEEKINLKGLLMGNPLSDTINQMNYADYWYQHGLVDMQEAHVIRTAQEKCISFILEKRYLDAFKEFSDIIFDSELTPHGTLFANYTGFTNVYNYLVPDDTDPGPLYMEQFLNRKDVKRALHVDDIEYRKRSQNVSLALRSDIVQSVASWLSELLYYYRVLIFTGQLDNIVAYPNVHNFVINMNYSKEHGFIKAPKQKWHVGEELAGYYKSAGNLTEIMVRNAGHMSTKDQPIWTLDMIGTFLNNRTFG